MGIPYQAFNCKSIIFTVAFIFLFSWFPAPVAAYDSLFIVENVKVDVTAENSVTAQNQAFDKAQIQAFRILTQRMVEEEQAESVETPDALTISSLVKDYEVTDEQLSSVRYIGTYTFRFREAAVSKFFSVSGVTFTETSSKPLLVLPVFQHNGKNTIWSEGNLWMQVWGSAELSGGLVPVEVPIGDLMDIADIDENQALSYERRKLDRMLGRYNAKEAAIMIAVPDKTLSSLDTQNQAVGRLRISIYRTDRAQAEHVQDLTLAANGQETVHKLYNRAVKKSYKALQKDWKSKTSTSASQSQQYMVRIPYGNIRQWVQIQKALKNVAGISELSILTVKQNEARVSFKFRGDEAFLREAVKRANMTLSQPYAKNVAFTQTQREAPDVIYDLTLGSTQQKKPIQQRTPDSFYRGVEPSSGATDNNSGVHTF